MVFSPFLSNVFGCIVEFDVFNRPQVLKHISTRSTPAYILNRVRDGINKKMRGSKLSVLLI